MTALDSTALKDISPDVQHLFRAHHTDQGVVPVLPEFFVVELVGHNFFRSTIVNGAQGICVVLDAFSAATCDEYTRIKPSTVVAGSGSTKWAGAILAYRGAPTTTRISVSTTLGFADAAVAARLRECVPRPMRALATPVPLFYEDVLVILTVAVLDAVVVVALALATHAPL